MANLRATPSGILVPSEARTGIPCGHCPRMIWKDREAKGRLFVLSGKPICAVCRIKRGKTGEQIKRDGRLLREDMDAREKLEKKQEQDRVIDIAIASQERHKDSGTEN